MNFSSLEVAAMSLFAGTMMRADGYNSRSETNLISKQFLSMGVDPEKAISAGISLGLDSAIHVIKGMPYRKKLFVVGFLTAIMGIDDDYDDNEYKVLSAIKNKIGEPDMDAAEAIKLYANLHDIVGVD